MGPAGVPVPPALGLCTDDAVNGAPFYVMGFVDGVIARNEADVEADFDLSARQRCGLAAGRHPGPDPLGRSRRRRPR